VTPPGSDGSIAVSTPRDATKSSQVPSSTSLSADDREELASYRSGRCQLKSSWIGTIRASLLIDFAVFIMRSVKPTVQHRTLPYGFDAILES
jgi:hypothetical protein